MDKKLFLFVTMMALLLTDIIITSFTLSDSHWEIYEIKGDARKHFGEYLNLGVMKMEIDDAKITDVSVHDHGLKIGIISTVVLVVVAMAFTMATIAISIYGYHSENKKIAVIAIITIVAGGFVKVLTVMYYAFLRKWNHPAELAHSHYGRALYIYSGSLLLCIMECILQWKLANKVGKPQPLMASSGNLESRDL